MIRDIARAMEIPFAEADKLAKLVPEPVQGKIAAGARGDRAEPELKQLYNESPLHRELLDLAASLEGLNRHAGMHAAGIVIAERPLWDHVPCFRGQNDEIVTQFAMKEVEKAGLVKFDFLGLKTLTVIQIAVQLINQQRPPGDELRHRRASRKDDADVYKLIARGDTTGVFQLESSGMREMLQEAQARLLRGHRRRRSRSIARARSRAAWSTTSSTASTAARRSSTCTRRSSAVLKDTYGVIVYQEQVMQIAQVLAGYTLGGADLLRRAMGKKKPEEMAKQKEHVRRRREGQGRRRRRSPTEIFELIEYFAGYGFNRSHSAAYGWSRTRRRTSSTTTRTSSWRA